MSVSHDCHLDMDRDVSEEVTPSKRQEDVHKKQDRLALILILIIIIRAKWLFEGTLVSWGTRWAQLIISENKFSQLLKAETMCYIINTFYSNFDKKSEGWNNDCKPKFLIAEFIDSHKPWSLLILTSYPLKLKISPSFCIILHIIRNTNIIQ